MRGRYLSESLQHGFTPNSLEDTFNQRLRWCTGGVQLFRLRFLSSAYWRGKMPLVARVSFFLNFGGDVIFVPLKVLVLFWPTLVALLPQGTLFPVGPPPSAPKWEAYLGNSATVLVLLGIIIGITGLFFMPNRAVAMGATIDVPLSFRLNAITSAGTYLPVQIKSAIDGLCPSKAGSKWNMGAKGGGGRIQGRWHPLGWFHVFFFALHSATLVYAIVMLTCRRCDLLYPDQSTAQYVTIYVFTALFCVLLVAGSCGVLGSYLWPLSARQAYSYSEVEHPKRIAEGGTAQAGLELKLEPPGGPEMQVVLKLDASSRPPPTPRASPRASPRAPHEASSVTFSSSRRGRSLAAPSTMELAARMYSNGRILSTTNVFMNETMSPRTMAEAQGASANRSEPLGTAATSRPVGTTVTTTRPFEVQHDGI